MAQWGEYQSLFQLSVALNTALAAISDFLGNAPYKGSKNAARLADRARGFQAIDAPQYKDRYTPIISGLTLAKGLYQHIYETYESSVQTVFRPLCIIIAAISFIGLIQSAINYTFAIERLWLILAYLQYLPIVIVAVFALYRSLISLREPNRRFRECSQALLDMENDFTERRQAG